MGNTRRPASPELRLPPRSGGPPAESRGRALLRRAATVFGIVVGIVGWLWPDVPTVWRFSIAACCCAIAVFGWSQTSALRVTSVGLAVVALIAPPVVIELREDASVSESSQTLEQDAVDRFYLETLEGVFWQGVEPKAFPSQELLEAEYESLSPFHNHAWADVDADATASIMSVMQSTGSYTGGVVETAGVVDAWQDLEDGTVVAQLTPFSPEEARKWPKNEHVQALFPDENDRLFSIFADPVRDPRFYGLKLYVRFTPPAFRIAQQGDFLAVKGVAVAHGTTLRHDGHLIELGYLAGAANDVIPRDDLPAAFRDQTITPNS